MAERAAIVTGGSSGIGLAIAEMLGEEGYGLTVAARRPEKHGVVGFTGAMNKELSNAGIKSCALCPAFVDTPMTDFVKGAVPAESMIRPQDIAESVRFLLRLSPGCIVPEVQFIQPGGGQL